MTMTSETQQTTEAEAAFRAISEAEWGWRLEDLGGEHYGGEAVDDFLPDVSAAAWRARACSWAE